MKDHRNLFFFFIIILLVGIAQGSTSFAENKYVIGDEDMLQISVWGNPELTVHVQVRPDGMISVPLVGDIKASGIAPQELKSSLENEFTRFVKAPTVSVIVTAVNSFKVFVLGEGIAKSSGTSSGSGAATSSGAISLRRNTTLLQLLSQLGSLQNADLTNSFLLRNGQKLTVDFYRLINQGDVSQDVQLVPNDLIFIPDNFQNRIMVIGAVKTPSVIQFREGMTTFDAILGAGGFTEFANPNDVVIVRKKGNGAKNIDVSLKDVMKRGEIDKDIPLQPGDRVIVKTGIF